MAEQATEKRKRGRPRKESATTAGGTVLALDRGLLVLETLARMQNATLSDLAEQVEMPLSTVHRILGTLQKHRFVDFEAEGQEWAVGIGAFKVGSTYLARSNLVEASLAVMRPLMEQTGETANLGIAEAGSIVFVSQIETKNPIRAMFRQGTGSPMHASGIGKAMLANMPHKDIAKMLEIFGQPSFTVYTMTTSEALFHDLDTISERGWALDNEERYIGMRCVAAAVYNAQGKAIAGLSVSGPTARFTEENIARIGPLVTAAADKLTAMTGGEKPRSQSV